MNGNFSGGSVLPVYALAVSDSDVYAGGFFTTAGGIAATNIAKWDGSSWSALGSGMGGAVSALGVSGGELSVVGGVMSAGGVSSTAGRRRAGCGGSALGRGRGAARACAS